MPKRTAFERQQQLGQPLPTTKTTETKIRRLHGEIGSETQVIFAICPLCGSAKQSHQLSFARDPKKSFGVVMGTRGRASMRKIRDLNPEDNADLFDLVKRHLLSAVEEWKQKGWL